MNTLQQFQNALPPSRFADLSNISKIRELLASNEPLQIQMVVAQLLSSEVMLMLDASLLWCALCRCFCTPAAQEIAIRLQQSPSHTILLSSAQYGLLSQRAMTLERALRWCRHACQNESADALSTRLHIPPTSQLRHCLQHLSQAHALDSS